MRAKKGVKTGSGKEGAKKTPGRVEYREPDRRGNTPGIRLH